MEADQGVRCTLHLCRCDDLVCTRILTTGHPARSSQSPPDAAGFAHLHRGAGVDAATASHLFSMPDSHHTSIGVDDVSAKPDDLRVDVHGLGLDTPPLRDGMCCSEVCHATGYRVVLVSTEVHHSVFHVVLHVVAPWVHVCCITLCDYLPTIRGVSRPNRCVGAFHCTLTVPVRWSLHLPMMTSVSVCSDIGL